MKIAVFQGATADQEGASDLSHLAEIAGDAVRAGARLLILSEMYLTGYHIGPDAVARRAEPVDGPSAQRAASIAKRTGMALLYGYPERGEDGRVYNAAILIDRDGRTLANHRKTHLFGDIDQNAFSPGEGPPTIAELDGAKIGILICYDVEFPENVRLLALEGADLVAVPTALMEPHHFVAQTMVPTRAFENQLFLAYANRVGRERELVYLGASCIVGPDGAELARAGADETLLTAELDLASLKRSKAAFDYARDRRPELYQALAGGRA